ncbi:MAG: NAD(P)H-dependent oxidoreductase subunit E [Anaerolineae bacterium]|nr:NAD(P)H-dependent oxidoreductase subunit E [Anaerolineae bacterium]
MIDTATTFDLAPLNQILEEYGHQKGAVIPILQRVQDAYGYLPREILAEISKRTNIPLTQLMGVATFYAQFRLKRRGKHLIRVCDGTACHVRGAPKNVEAIQAAFNLDSDGTSPDYAYTMEIVYCIGSCGLAPVAVVDDKVFGRLEAAELVERMREIAREG